MRKLMPASAALPAFPVPLQDAIAALNAAITRSAEIMSAIGKADSTIAAAAAEKQRASLVLADAATELAIETNGAKIVALEQQQLAAGEAETAAVQAAERAVRLKDALQTKVREADASVDAARTTLQREANMFRQEVERDLGEELAAAEPATVPAGDAEGVRDQSHLRCRRVAAPLPDRRARPARGSR